MMHGKAIWKPGIAGIAKASRSVAPQGALTLTPWNPQLQCADTRWVIAYDHETQSFMKNGGQQKCLDKALY